MTLTYIINEKQWVREVPLDPAIKYAAETPSGALFTIRDDGRVLIGDVELSDADSLAYHKPSAYPIMHSGEASPVVESNGYVTAAWMGNGPDVGFGTPIWMAVWQPDKGVVRYQMPYAGVVLDGNPNSRRGIDNHCLPQLFVRGSDKRIIYVEGGHNNTIHAGVSHSPHAAYGFHRLYPIGPESRYTNNGHTYPAAVLIGDTLHLFSRFLDGDYSLIYFEVDTRTMLTGQPRVLDKAPQDHKYAIWYQQPRIEGGKLIVTTNRRWRPKDKPDTFLTDPEPQVFEVSI